MSHFLLHVVMLSRSPLPTGLRWPRWLPSLSRPIASVRLFCSTLVSCCGSTKRRCWLILLVDDPELESVVNVNAPADYAIALGRPTPLITVESFGATGAEHGRGRRTVRAATIGAAAEAAGVTWDPHVFATLNGDHAGGDVDLPLVSGDAVAFLSTIGGG
jgi:hypothetical protein